MSDFLQTSLDRVLAWAKGQNYEGYSKFDAFNSPVIRALSLNSPYIRMFISPLWARSPVNPRPLARTTKSRNPKGIALFALAYLRRFQASGGNADLEEAKKLLDWLLENPCKGYSGICWGYDHDWQNLFFYAPKYTPNIVVTGNVAYAFLEAYETTGEKLYLETAESVTDWMLKDLAAPISTPDMRNIGYIPGSDWAVLNINGLASAILIWTWQHTKAAELKNQATRLMAFLVDKQTDYGAWHYAWPARTSNVKHDNYHTGNVLDWVLDYSVRSGDGQFMDAFRKGFAFYLEKLFTRRGAPKWRSDRTYPLDAHGAAQAVVTLSKAAAQYEAVHLPMARKVAEWAVDNLQAPEGYFYYQKGRFLTKKYTLMRWCNAWMAHGLASLLLTENQLASKA